MEYTGLLYSSKFVKTEVYRFLIHMAAFGASTSKPSYLYSNHTCFKDCRLSRCSPKASNSYHNLNNQIPIAVVTAIVATVCILCIIIAGAVEAFGDPRQKRLEQGQEDDCEKGERRGLAANMMTPVLVTLTYSNTLRTDLHPHAHTFTHTHPYTYICTHTHTDTHTTPVSRVAQYTSQIDKALSSGTFHTRPNPPKITSQLNLQYN